MARDNYSLGQFSLEGIPPATRGFPQIEVTFEIDANGILNVSAEDRATDIQMTITNEKGRLSLDEINEMVAQAERFKAEDDIVRSQVEAKNCLDSYVYTVKNSLSDVKLSEKFTPEDKSTVEQKLNEVMQWLEGNQDAQTEELESKKQELEAVVNPIMTKIYQESASEAGNYQSAPEGPSVETTD